MTINVYGCGGVSPEYRRKVYASTMLVETLQLAAIQRSLHAPDQKDVSEPTIPLVGPLFMQVKQETLLDRLHLLPPLLQLLPSKESAKHQTEA
nr:unnamed protein product [Callosobruchus chinensis]